MGSWRSFAIGAALLTPVAVFGAAQTTPWLVIPPLVAAFTVLFVAALAVDYFGVARRRHGWAGVGADPRRAWLRARILERRFGRQKAKGSPRTAWTARSLLLALAECDRLDDAAGVVDFLGADAVYTRVGSDATADALRAVALAEIGRVDQARELCQALEENRMRRHLPVVAYACARVAEIDHRPAEALERVDKALRRRRLPATAQRDLLILRARALVAMARAHDATEVLVGLVVDGWKREVEQLSDHARARGDAGLALAARSALCRATPYR
jgi:hypothetical protein